MWRKIALFLAICISAGSCWREDVARELRSGMTDFFANKQISPDFKNYLSTLNLMYAFYDGAEQFIDPELLCTVCIEGGEVAIEERRNGATAEDLADVVIELCAMLIDTRDACTGLVNIMVDTGLYIIDNSPNITSGHLCAVVAQSYGCEGEVPDWSINIPERTEIATSKKSTYDEEPIRILHIADIHYDPLYLVGSNAICDTYVCCQADLGMADDPANGAGFWGDYRGCDSPLHVIQNSFASMKENGEYDYIYFTGDIISHRMWDTSEERNIAEAHEIHEELHKAFPDTPIFSIFGNHEAHPVNCYAPTSVPEPLSSQWLYDDVAELWGHNFPEDAKDTIRRGGFYSVLVRPGFRVIGINGNTGYRYNWWILYEADPLGQLQWLSDVLFEAEQNGEKVHILSHNPSSEGSAFTIWSREYRRIVDRFAHIITGTFNGHTHQDEIILYHSLENPTEPINVAWNGGSVTTISNLNNNYRIFTMDPNSFDLLDFDVWSFNVTHANLTPDREPEWFKLYSFKETYGVEDLSPQSIRDLAIRMTQDHDLARTYWRYRHRLADTQLASGCGESCLKGLVCRMLKSEVSDSTQCDEITGNW